MKTRIAILLLSLLSCTSLFAQEQLTFIESFTNEDSNPIYVGSVSNKTIFTVNKTDTKGVQRKELWVTDGTEAGTFSVNDNISVIQIQSDIYGSGATNVLSKNGYVYFEVASSTSSTISELWRTDGTISGTKKVIDIIAQIPYSTARRLYFHASENYFFITSYLYDSGIGPTAEVNKYDNNFMMVDHTPKYLIYSIPVKPYLYKDKIYFAGMDDTLIRSNTNIEPIGFYEQKFEWNNKIYQFYRLPDTRLIKAFVYDGNQMVVFQLNPNTLDHPNGYNILSSRYFVYNGQIYVLLVGTTDENADSKHLNVELYTLNEDGFKFKSGLMTEPSMYAIESLWQDQGMVHIITREKNYSGNSAIVFKHHKIDIEKEYPAARSVKVIFEGDKGDIFATDNEFLFLKKDREVNENFIYRQQTETLVPITADINLYALNAYKVAPDNYFITPKPDVPNGSRKGSEPYWFNSSTNDFKLLKDINTTQKGIGVNSYSNDFTLNNNALIWTSVQEKGVVLYKSDGTKEGTQPVKTISSNRYSFWEKRTLMDSYFTYACERARDGQDAYQTYYYKEKYFSFITDGTENGTHFIDESWLGHYILKSDENYYRLYGALGSDSIKVIKITSTGQQELIRKIGGEGLKGIYPVKDDFLLMFTKSPSNSKYRIVSALTGNFVEIGGYIPRIWSLQQKRLIFTIYDEANLKTEVYTYEKHSLKKLLTIDGYETSYRAMDNELAFYDKKEQKMSIVDLTSAEVTVIPVLVKDYSLSSIIKVNGVYYSQLSKANPGGKTDYKAQLFKNDTAVEIKIPSEIDNPNDYTFSGSVIINNTPYFYHYGIHSKGEFPVTFDIYRVENNAINRVASVGDQYEFFPNRQAGNAFFINPNGKIVVWQESGIEEILSGGYILENLVQIGDKYIFEARFPALNGGSRIYVTDGTKAGTKLLKEFTNSFFIFKVIKNKAYFSASTPETGNEPWITDGTPEGTKLIGDLWEGTASSNPANFREVGGLPVCLASTPDLGQQLFSLQKFLASPLLAAPNTQACEGDTIMLTASKGFDAYKWMIDDGKEIITTDNKLNVTKSGTYKVIVSKENVSSYPSNEVSIHFISLPAKPSIKQENTQLSVTATGQLQWYFNGSAITGATTNTLAYTGVGDYSVKLTQNGCSVFSDKQFVSITSTEQLLTALVYPNPASNKLMISSNDSQPVQLKLLDIKGKVVLQKKLTESVNEIDLRDLTKGVYILQLNQHTKKIIIE